MKRYFLLTAAAAILTGLVFAVKHVLSSAKAPLPTVAPLADRGIKVVPSNARPAAADQFASKSSSGKAGTSMAGIFALTFDDGPHPVNTPAILDWLKKNQIKATFFVLGEKAKRYPDLLRRMATEGHEIGNHTWSHPDLSKLKPEAVRREIKSTHDLILSLTGKAPVSFRPPYGSLTAAQDKTIAKDFGYRIVRWNADSLDWKLTSAAAVEQELRAHVKPGSILLAHDIHPRILPALETLRAEWTCQGLKAVPLEKIVRKPLLAAAGKNG